MARLQFSMEHTVFFMILNPESSWLPFEMASGTNLVLYDQIHHNISRVHNAHLYFLISPVGRTCQIFFHISPLCI